MKIRTLLFVLLIGTFSIQAQVRDIKKDAQKAKKEKKHSSGSSSSSSSGGGSNILADAIYKGVVLSLVMGQIGSLKQIDTYPQVLSVEFNGQSAFNPQIGEVFLGPEFRGNFGIFATEVRMNTFGDAGEQLTTLDWQWFKFNAPIMPVRFSMGIGFTRVMEINTYYPEYTLDLEINPFRNKFVLFAGLRTANIDANTHFRREFNARAELNVVKWGKLYLNPHAGVSFKNYLNKYDQFYVTGGFNFRWNFIEDERNARIVD